MAIDEKKLIEDCKKYLEDTYTFQTPLEYSAAMTRLLKIIEAQPKLDVPDTNVGKWIPIKHDPQSGWLYNLPDDGQEVLVCWSEYGRITLDTFVNEGEDGCWWENGDYVEVGQAWMPLP